MGQIFGKFAEYLVNYCNIKKVNSRNLFAVHLLHSVGDARSVYVTRQGHCLEFSSENHSYVITGTNAKQQHARPV